jgi:hypothetical protein
MEIIFTHRKELDAYLLLSVTISDGLDNSKVKGNMEGKT